MKPDILTKSGHYFNFETPDKCTFGIEDIAHALAHICRFTGHTTQFYSVAQHSVMVSKVVAPEFAMYGLLHDAAEAFIGDVSSPLKAMLPQYKEIEKRVESAVLARFGLGPDLPPEIKAADLVLLATEKRDVMPSHSDLGRWGVVRNVQPLAERIVPWTHSHARDMFIIRYYQIRDMEAA